jgi:hypothetical protein
MSRMLLVAALLLSVFSVHAQTAEAPVLKAGDSWTFRTTTERAPSVFDKHDEDSTIDRVSATTIFLETKPTGSPLVPTEMLFGTDWSRSRDIGGKQTAVSRPFEFPLVIGKTWDLSFTEANPNPKYSIETYEIHSTVVGWEYVEVPAGKFRALKVETEGTWSGMTAAISSGSATTTSTAGGATAMAQAVQVKPHQASGRIYKVYWYVPGVKRPVKSVEESYTTKGMRYSRYTTELVSDKVGS